MGESFATNLDADTPAISAPQSSTSEHSRDWADAASRCLIVIVAIILAWYTWASWGDIQIDCGRELYVPTEILRGKLLYRDIFYPYGPLAPYLGALLIAIFGSHLVVFYLFGIAVAISCAMLLLEIGTMLESRAVGLTAALALILQAFDPGIFNYVFPYSYAATMGLTLSLACVYFAVRHALGRPGYNLLIAGMAAGLATLSKQEMGAACYLMLTFLLVMETIRQRSMRRLLHGVGACVPGVALCIAVYGWFFWTLTPAFMVEANWVGLPGTAMHAFGAHFYSALGQRFAPSEVAQLIAADGLTLLIWFLVARVSWNRPNAALAVAIAFACLFHFAPFKVAALLVSAAMILPRGMFFIGCAFLGYTLYELCRKGVERRLLAEAALGIFALLPATRVMVEIKPFGYSIYYAIPLFLVFVITSSRCIKAAVPVLSDESRRKLVNSLLAAEVVMVAIIGIPHENLRTDKLETSWGEMYLTPNDASVARQMLSFISEQKRHGRQVALVPEATTLYALTATEAPGRWYMVVPGILSLAQEQVFLADLNREAPDYIMLTARRTSEYGADYFGIDYDQKIYHWIESNYRVVGQFGHFIRDAKDEDRKLAALLYEKEGSGHAARSGELSQADK